MCPDGDHDGRVTRGYLFNCLQLVEPVLGTRGSFGATLSQKAGAGARMTRDHPRAAPSWETGAGATGTCGGPGAALSREVGARVMGTRGSPGATTSLEAGARALGHTSTRAPPCLLS
jgi:hypothetical protein